MSAIRAGLLAVVRREATAGSAFAAAILKHGRWFEGKARPGDVALGVPHQCRANAQRAALAEPDRWDYAEGFGIHPADPFAVQHAWVVDTVDGRAVDVTWDRPGTTYYGVARTVDELRVVLERTAEARAV